MKGVPIIWLYVGIVAFSAVVGFLSGTNNSSMLSVSLFAAVTAIGGVIAFIQKLFTPGAASPTVNTTDLTNSLMNGPDEPLTRRMLAYHLDKAPVHIHAGQRAGMSTEQANTLGVMLTLLSAGYALGLWLGILIHSSYPLLLGEKVRVTVPWSTPEQMPGNFDEAVGWLAVSERLRGLGMSDGDVHDVYARFRQDRAARANIAQVGSKWLVPQRAAPAPAPAPATGATAGQ